MSKFKNIIEVTNVEKRILNDRHFFNIFKKYIGEMFDYPGKVTKRGNTINVWLPEKDDIFDEETLEESFSQVLSVMDNEISSLNRIMRNYKKGIASKKANDKAKEKIKYLNSLRGEK